MRSLPNVQLTSQLEGDIWSVRSGSECSELGLQSRGRAPRTQTKGELQHQLPQPAPGYRLLPAALFIDSVGCLLSPSVCQAQPDHQPSSSSHSFPQTNGSSCGMKSNVFPTAQLLLVWSREGSGAGLPLLLRSFILSAQDTPCAFPVGIKMQRTTCSFPSLSIRNCASQNLRIGNGSQETLCTIPLILSGNSCQFDPLPPN